MKLSIMSLFFLFFIFSSSGFSASEQQSEFLASDNIFSKQVAQHHFALGDIYLELYDAEHRKPIMFDKVISNYQQGLLLDPGNAEYQSRLGFTYHMMRRLKEASVAYKNALRIDPPKLATQKDIDLAIKYAPRVFLHAKEYFELEDVVAVIHPDKPIVAYHFFWDDDIDYPADNDPADHEVVWIKFDQKSGKVTGVYTYFHRALFTTEEAVKEANLNNQRARINIQWGQHGSLPVGWEKLKPEAYYSLTGIKSKIKTVETRYNNAVKGRRLLDHPLTKDWPARFEGSFEEYTTYNKYLDIRPMFKNKRKIIISKWSNAVIDHYFLDYNFFPKIEWPWGGDK